MAELFMADIGADGSFENVRTMEEKAAHLENSENQNESTESSTKYPPATVPVISENPEQKEDDTLITGDIVSYFEGFMPFSDGSLYHKKSKIYPSDPNRVSYNDICRRRSQ